MLALGLALLPLAGFGRELRVGVSGSAPFVIGSDGPDGNAAGEGISVDVWEEIADANELDYRLVPMPSTEANVRAVGQGDLDLAIGPISITAERLKSGRIEFSQPYFYGKVGVLLPAEPPSLWSRIRPFFGVAALSSVGVLLLSLFLVGNLIWLAERRRNPDHFPPSYRRGVGNGVWFALVTLTTVGYGDRAPVTATGRFLAGLWMVLTLLAVSSITAGLASAFTVSLSDARLVSIREPSDLRGARLAVVAGTTSRRWADAVGARAVVSPSLEAAVALLRQGRVEGVLFDQPALRYAMRQETEVPLRLAPFGLGTQTYGMVLPLDSELRLPIDVSLLELHRSGGIKAITERWLGS